MPIKNPEEEWTKLAKLSTWREYILPNRTDEEFELEGKLQTEWLQAFIDIRYTDIVLDYGCGIGRVTKYIADHCSLAIGLDISEDFILKARKECESNFKVPIFFTTDTFKHQYNVADIICCFMVLQHNDSVNRRLILDHIKQLLKSGGRAIINFPNKEEYPPIPTSSKFMTTFTREEVEEYGKLFSNYEIIEGNLVNYNPQYIGNKREYFLKVTA